ncbi:MAG: P-II family nitrogen regulator, partial [Clostridia bacterium]|nr:P-II family nitrogen regulator [Clostridia bacterium]
MSAARPAGATGGTVLNGKGTGARESEKFLGISLASEKDVVLIVAEKARKAAIMKAIMKNAGPGTEAAAICFSLPVTNVEGLRRIDAEDEAEKAE